MARPNLFIVSGPSGSGKSTVVDYLLQNLPHTVFSVSHTTRPPRTGEKNGRDYFFTTVEEFEDMKVREEFLESNFHFGHFYGTHISNLERAREEGNDLLLDVDIEGARQIKAKLPEAVAILFIPPSREELERRLRRRGQDAEDVIRRRLKRAHEEISRYAGYDYLVVNDDLEQAKAQVRAIVCIHRTAVGRAGEGCDGETARMRSLADAAREENNAAKVSAILDTFTAGESSPG